MRTCAADAVAPTLVGKPEIMIAPSDGTRAAATKISGDFGSRCFMGNSKVSSLPTFSATVYC
jgi:hypothetical protein